MEAMTAMESSIRFHSGKHTVCVGAGGVKRPAYIAMHTVSLRGAQLSDLHMEPFGRALAGNRFIKV